MSKPFYKLRFSDEVLDGYYIRDARCENCGAIAQVHIRDGFRIKKVPPLKCEACGCKDLVPR